VDVLYGNVQTCAEMRGAGATIGIQTVRAGSAKAFNVSYNAATLEAGVRLQRISYQSP
jgi:hypothetical protein